MFSINGIALDDDTREWVVRSSSAPLAGTDIDRSTLSNGGQDGNVTGLPSRRISPTVSLVIETPRAEGREALLALLGSDPIVLTDSNLPGKQALLEVLTLSDEEDGGGDEDDPVVLVTMIARIPGVFWRDTDEATSTPAALGSGSVEVEVMPNLSAPVRDAIVRVKGGTTNLLVTDSHGTFFGYSAVLPSTSYLRFDSATGKAWITTSDTWSGGTEVTGDIEIGPGEYPLEVTPSFTDPSDRKGVLTVTTTARTGSPTVEVRGRRAYRV